MPIYNFTCIKCNSTSEYIALNFNDTPKECPFCQEKNNLKKIPATFGSYYVLNDYELGKKPNWEAHYPNRKDPITLYPKGYL